MNEDPKLKLKGMFIDNLQSAKNIGWKTVWINPNCNNVDNENYIDYKFKNIISALEYFKDKL